MTAVLLSAEGTAKDLSVLDAFLYAVIGFLIVLAVLALLVGIFYLSGFLFRTKAMSGDKLFSIKKKERSTTDKASDDDGSSDEEVVAAISAAITVLLTEENGGEKPEFVIRRVTRKK